VAKFRHHQLNDITNDDTTGVDHHAISDLWEKILIRTQYIRHVYLNENRAVMKTLVGLLRLCKWFSYQKSVKLRRNVAKGVKNKHSEKDPKNTCAKKWDPYNAPPSTRRM
jgi:hypothetical protein